MSGRNFQLGYADLISFETRGAGILPQLSPLLTKKSGVLSHATALVLFSGLM